MKISIKAQYALLFALFIRTKKITTVEVAAEALGLSRYLVTQIARDLRLADLVKATMGPGGGYQIVGDPTIAQVLNAVRVVPFEHKKAHHSEESTCIQHLEYLMIVKMFTGAIQSVLDTPISKIELALPQVAKEAA